MSKRHFLGFEARHQPLLSRSAFAKRLAANFVFALALIAISLAAGMMGYHWLEGMDWIDAFLNAAMILGGMGPITPLQTHGGKLFAGLYAIYCGLALIIATGIVLAPVLHRVMHKFHLAAEKGN